MLGRRLYVMFWALLWVCRRVWWNWTIMGLDHLRPRGQGMILAVNHLHWTDTYILGASLPRSLQPTWLAKEELFAHPLAAWWLRAINAIPVSRQRRDLSALVAAEDALRQGAALIIFVEGHRSVSGGLQAGQGGAVRLALRTGCPIVPIALCGTEAGMRGAFLRKPIDVRIGQPYYVLAESPKVPQQRMNELVDEMMLRLAALLPEQYRGIYRERMAQLQVKTEA
ncbi:MAG TPA: lysophospholipid acyltransferase family protein [Roseiflexaceae bacterium]|nr:lysophospholipid acyltransferase family protein [Roseiflexaceae bacterium]